MKLLARTVVSAVAASVGPALPFFAMALLLGNDFVSFVAAFVAWIVATAHVVVLGIPAFFLLRRNGLANAVSLAITGFVLGFLPAAIYMADAVGHDFYAPISFGAVGTISALAFWITWDSLGPNYSIQRTAGRILD